MPSWSTDQTTPPRRSRMTMTNGRRVLRALDDRCPERTVDAGNETDIRGVVVLMGSSERHRRRQCASARPAWQSTTSPPRPPCGEPGPSDGRAISRRGIRPELHQGAPLLEEVAARVGGLGLVPDHVRKHRLHHRVRRMGWVGGVVTEPLPPQTRACAIDALGSSPDRFAQGVSSLIRRSRNAAPSPVRLSAAVSCTCWWNSGFPPTFPISGSVQVTPRFPPAGPDGHGSPPSAVLSGRYDFLPSHVLRLIGFASRLRGCLSGSVSALSAPAAMQARRRTGV